LLFGNGFWVIDLVAKDEEGCFGELFHCELLYKFISSQSTLAARKRRERGDTYQSVELSLCLGKPLMIFGIDEEYDAGDFGEILHPLCQLIS
jgi:hypothetical protein